MTPKPFQEFPKMVYHKSKPPVVVTTKEEQNALGGEWREQPFSPEETQNHEAQSESAPPTKSVHKKEK